MNEPELVTCVDVRVFQMRNSREERRLLYNVFFSFLGFECRGRHPDDNDSLLSDSFQLSPVPQSSEFGLQVYFG